MNAAIMNRGEIVLEGPANSLDETEVRRHLTV
jgi:ABC-type branched-subunit amino acid transport system ATPase component